MKNLIVGLVDSVGHNDSLRFDCPVCGGRNTLSITKESGEVKFNCYKASCDLHGKGRYLASTDAIKSQLEGRTTAKRELAIPDYLIYGNASKKCLSLLSKTNCLETYNKGLFDVAYDPRQDRICFLVKKDNKIVGIIGRASNPKTVPKVLNYEGSDPETPFIVGNTDTIVLVEDCPSAASVARIPELSGLAMLGTSLKNEYILTVKLYKKIIVACDRDARKKTLDIWNKMKYYSCHSKIEPWFLSRDIKDQDDEELLYNYKQLS